MLKSTRNERLCVYVFTCRMVKWLLILFSRFKFHWRLWCAASLWLCFKSNFPSEISIDHHSFVAVFLGVQQVEIYYRWFLFYVRLINKEMKKKIMQIFLVGFFSLLSQYFFIFFLWTMCINYYLLAKYTV